MPFSMKLWQVKGKDLKEVKQQALDDAERLEEWLVKTATGHEEYDWVVVQPDAVVIAGGKTSGNGKSAFPSSSSMAFQETRSRAENGDASAQAALGFLCELGIHTKVDGAEAVRWYRKAADRGNARAQLNLRQIAELGFMYERGIKPPADPEHAVETCRKAAEKGNARAQFSLGQMFEWGDGSKQDFAEAAKWYGMAAEQGVAAAQFMAGMCYCNGQGVKQNTEQAVKWWRDAAEQGEAAAQFKLGLCYCNGQGVPQDYAEGVKWYREAAEQGETVAQAKLGDAYYIGLGVAASYADAVKWYREAAEHGHASAQRHLGIMYGLGQGVRQDSIQAYKWYTLAAAQNDPSAIHNRNVLTASMTAAQIAEARRLTGEYAAGKENGALNGGNHKEEPGAAPRVVEQEVQEKPRQSRRVVNTTGGTAAILGMDVLLVGRKVPTPGAGTIDLLAIDARANMVVLVLKRDQAAHELLAQTLDYASWVKSLSYKQIDAMTNSFTGQPLDRAFSGHFGVPVPERVNTCHSMLILTSELDQSSERIVRYLADNHKVPIQVMLIGLFKTSAGEFLARARG